MGLAQHSSVKLRKIETFVHDIEIGEVIRLRAGVIVLSQPVGRSLPFQLDFVEENCLDKVAKTCKSRSAVYESIQLHHWTDTQKELI